MLPDVVEYPFGGHVDSALSWNEEISMADVIPSCRFVQFRTEIANVKPQKGNELPWVSEKLGEFLENPVINETLRKRLAISKPSDGAQVLFACIPEIVTLR